MPYTRIQSRHVKSEGTTPDEALPMNSVMLALSTFRQSEKAVELAMQKAGTGKTLIVVYVVDLNVARYLVGMDVGLLPNLAEQAENEFLKEHETRAQKQVKSLAAKAQQRNINVRVYTNIGRFGLECMKVVEKEKPEEIVTTRSSRPAWVRRFFGSPVDYLVANAGCPVVEA